MQTNAYSLTNDITSTRADFFRPSRSSSVQSPNHVSQRPTTQLWANLDAEQARHDFSHRVVYAVLALGSMVPPLWTLLAQHAATL